MPTVIPTALSGSISPMPRALFILSFSSIVVLLQDCSLSNQQSQQVQQIGDGTYAIGVSKTSSFMNSSSWTKGLDAAVGKAGDYCHAKGLKLVNTQRDQGRRRCVVESATHAAYGLALVPVRV
jgi:hypothetical protein